jgi:hypothetical protein
MAWKWFGVKMLFRTIAEGTPVRPDASYDQGGTLVEERVLVVRARSHAEAHRKAEAEAKQYVAHHHLNPYGQRVRTRRLAGSESFEMFAAPSHMAEVWSSTRVVPSRVSDAKVLDTFLGPKEVSAQPKRRKKYLNREFSGIVA